LQYLKPTCCDRSQHSASYRPQPSAVLRHQTRHFANRVEAWPSFLAFAPPLQPWRSIWGVDVQRLSQNYTLVSFFSFLVTPRSMTLRPLPSDHVCHGFMTACLTSAPPAGHAGSGNCPVHGERSVLHRYQRTSPSVMSVRDILYRNGQGPMVPDLHNTCYSSALAPKCDKNRIVNALDVPVPQHKSRLSPPSPWTARVLQSATVNHMPCHPTMLPHESSSATA
jgi:hypothetical protein